jgi:hypothetical protein
LTKTIKSADFPLMLQLSSDRLPDRPSALCHVGNRLALATACLQEELAAAERCSAILMKLARAKDVPQCQAGRTGAALAEKVEASLKELLEHLQRTSVPIKLAVAR